MTTEVRTHTFTVDEYHRMIESGILTKEHRVELIEGEIVDMTPIGNPHMAAVARLTELLVPALTGRAIVRVQGSIQLDDRSQPEPDLVILRRRDDFYANSSAMPTDALLVVEVADSSLAFDRDRKGPLYAKAAVQEFWLVDIQGESITAYREPTPLGYRSTIVARRGDSLAPIAFPELSISVEDVLPFAA